MHKHICEAVREHVGEIPPHIHAIANAVRYDLLHGPSWLLLPGGDVTRVTDDCLVTFREDLAADAEPGDVIEETYSGRAAAALRDWIADLPCTLYIDEDGFVSTSEPEGDEVDLGEVDDDGNPVLTWCDPSPYYVVEGRELIECLFGKTIAREFN